MTCVVQEQMEQMLEAAEDEDDIQAQQVVRQEQAAQTEEFDENIPWDEREAAERQSQVSRLEQQLALLDKEVTTSSSFRIRHNKIAQLVT